MNEAITLWCNVKDDLSLFFVEITPEHTVAHLRKLIHKEAFGDGQLPLAKDLVLYKVSCSYVAHL
jgi:Crinkler effector protein N-terminal domain